MINHGWMTNPTLRNERLLHTVMAVLMLVFIACANLLQSRIGLSVEDMETNGQECRELCQSETDLRSALDQSLKKHAGLTQEFASIVNRIPKKIVDSEVLSTVRSIAQATGCNIIDFRPTSTQRQKDFQTRAFELHLEGGFNSLFEFFESLQRAPFVCQIGRFKIMEPTIPGGACRFDLELKVVFDHVWAKQE
jgi:Tfp pilus assembly protein PilO